MAMCDYYLCDVCGQKCFYDASIAEYDDDGRYLLSGSAVDIAAICETCAKTHKCIVVPRDTDGLPTEREVLSEFKRLALTDIAYGLERYVEYHGAIHDDDCPCDDTCGCQYKSTNDAVNSACRLIRTMAKAGTGIHRNDCAYLVSEGYYNCDCAAGEAR